ncbi:MAG: heavy-metal-associated domain-containing protein, partial [Eubacteriales bacterium]|nr:heavy-metal-associated domain-containing protein [Eubacteriales bacterium]
DAARNTNGVKDAQVSFMTLKMKVDFADGADEKAVMKQVKKNCKKVESDCDIYI